MEDIMDLAVMTSITIAIVITIAAVILLLVVSIP
jgi:hypothetical protein